VTAGAIADPVRPAVVTVAAPAKVNLYLHVTGRRPDGYHLLDSLVAFAGVGDTVEATPADTLSLTIDGPQAGALAAEPDNLVLRAARLLAEAAGQEGRGAALRLTKRLPVASGIGGGSADAAAALRALAALWGLALDDPRPMEIAPRLGADVPVCLLGRTVHMGGVGELLTPAPALPPVWLVLANPGIPCPTPPVFKARRGPFSDPAPLTTAPADAQSLATALAARRNDLAEAATALVPEIATVLAELAALPGCLLSRLSGSGATGFGLFAESGAAQRGAAALQAERPGWWVAAAPLLPDGHSFQEAPTPER